MSDEISTIRLVGGPSDDTLVVTDHFPLAFMVDKLMEEPFPAMYSPEQWEEAEIKRYEYHWLEGMTDERGHPLYLCLTT